MLPAIFKSEDKQKYGGILVLKTTDTQSLFLSYLIDKRNVIYEQLINLDASHSDLPTDLAELQGALRVVDQLIKTLEEELTNV